MAMPCRASPAFMLQEEARRSQGSRRAGAAAAAAAISTGYRRPGVIEGCVLARGTTTSSDGRPCMIESAAPGCMPARKPTEFFQWSVGLRPAMTAAQGTALEAVMPLVQAWRCMVSSRRGSAVHCCCAAGRQGRPHGRQPWRSRQRLRLRRTPSAPTQCLLLCSRGPRRPPLSRRVAVWQATQAAVLKEATLHVGGSSRRLRQRTAMQAEQLCNHPHTWHYAAHCRRCWPDWLTCCPCSPPC